MIIIKKITNILFFILMVFVIVFLLNQLEIISFLTGLLRILIPVFLGLFISIVLEEIIKRFINKGYKRKLVVIVTYITLLLTLIVASIIILPRVIKQVSIFIETLPLLIDNAKHIFLKYNIDITSIIEFGKPKIVQVMNYIGEGIGVIFNVGITLSSAFFISLDYPRIKEVIKDLIPDIIKKEVIYFFSRYLPFFSKYMYALFIDSLITFVVSFLLFFIFGVDYSLICAFIVTITNLIPYIGPFLGVIPLVIIGYSVSPYFAIVSLVIVLVVQIFESNLIQPLIFKNVIKIHPLEGIIGLLVFSYLFSIIGMIASPLLVVAFKLLFIEKYKPESHIESKSIQ